MARKYAPKAPPGRRWGSLKEYSRAIKIGSKTWEKMPYRLRQLTAWRGDHLNNKHLNVRRFARSYGVAPSSNITLGTKVSYFEGRKKRGKV